MTLKAALLLICGLYGAYAALMVWIHPRLIYPFSQDEQVIDGFSRSSIAGPDGDVSFQEHAGDGPVVLYFMGNAGAVSLFEGAFEAHVAAGRHVVAMEYRGGGGRPGKPSEKALKADALALADYALSLEKPVVVQGYSLGTGLATHVAARRSIDQVILTAPYDRLCKLMSERSWLPACLLPGVQTWSSIEDAAQITAPVHVFHGTEDQLVPSRYSEAFEALGTVRRTLVSGAAHNDIGGFAAYRTKIEAVFDLVR